jgi:hypothetical protein
MQRGTCSQQVAASVMGGASKASKPHLCSASVPRLILLAVAAVTACVTAASPSTSLHSAGRERVHAMPMPSQCLWHHHFVNTCNRWLGFAAHPRDCRRRDSLPGLVGAPPRGASSGSSPSSLTTSPSPKTVPCSSNGISCALITGSRPRVRCCSTAGTRWVDLYRSHAWDITHPRRMIHAFDRTL